MTTEEQREKFDSVFLAFHSVAQELRKEVIFNPALNWDDLLFIKNACNDVIYDCDRRKMRMTDTKEEPKNAGT